jgi:hypothetical protein
MLEQMRNGIDKIISIDEDAGHITRGTAGHDCRCRVSYQSGGVWNYQLGDTGATITTTPYVLAEYDADIEEGDILQWRDRRFQVGAVSQPSFDGGVTCLQAQLKEIQA